jgi:hypothetical protein
MSGEVLEDPTLSARIQARADELAAARVEDLTVAQRLTRKALEAPTVWIDVGSAEDPLDIEVRIPLLAEVDYLSTLNHRLNEVKDLKGYQRVMREAAEVVGALCIDPSLNADFWTSGIVSTEVFFGIIKAANDAATTRLKEARSFRAKTKR